MIKTSEKSIKEKLEGLEKPESKQILDLAVLILQGTDNLCLDEKARAEAHRKYDQYRGKEEVTDALNYIQDCYVRSNEVAMGNERICKKKLDWGPGSGSTR